MLLDALETVLWILEDILLQKLEQNLQELCSTQGKTRQKGRTASSSNLDAVVPLTMVNLIEFAIYRFISCGYMFPLAFFGIQLHTAYGQQYTYPIDLSRWEADAGNS